MPKLLTVGIWCMIVCTGLCFNCRHVQSDDEGDADDIASGIHPEYRNMMIHFVIMRGCAYTAGYVRSQIVSRYHPHFDDRSNPPISDTNKTRRFLQDPGHDRSCDWKSWLFKTGLQYHVPHELTYALYDCGLSFSLMAFNESESRWSHCIHNGTATMEVAVGKRYAEYVSSIEMDLLYNADGDTYESLQNLNHNDESMQELPIMNVWLNTDDHHHDDDHEELETHSGYDSDRHGNSHQHGYSNSLKSWCRKFSCKILKTYHFSEILFKHTSQYWLVDIFRTAVKYHIPKNYTYSLVGCGMRYTLKAFNAQDHTMAYT